MVTAQETHREMMKTQIAPRIRALVFKGSGQKYELRSPHYWALLGFQKSAFSDASQIRFTVNVAVVSRPAWDAARKDWPDLPTRTTADVPQGPVWWRRLGQLIHDGQEIWWVLGAVIDTAELAAAVLWAVEDYALPALRAQMTVA
jgi:hypothetical protein